ncbi:MAG: small ribosomal subunit biogenesis GTPase RsgA [Gammaproteobacteria bacterium]|nr:small ribosomal subunit biogenesis GTPase RsgA [Gammaproteobacteria bacterium]
MPKKKKLSQKQSRMTKKIQASRVERVRKKASTLEQEISESELGPEQEGRLITNYGASVDVEDSNGIIHRCAYRQNLESLVSGDRVVWQPAHDERGVVTAVMERTSLLARPDFTGNKKPVAANIDQMIIVSASKPGLNEGLIDRYLLAAENIHITPVILLNKVDLLDDRTLADYKERLSDYIRIGYPVIYASTKREHGLDALQKTLKEKTSILVGRSGVGKSSLVNRILPDANIKTGEVSEATGKGQHTTSAARLYHLSCGGELIDSPGVREFGLWNLSRDEATYGFIEFRQFIGKCKFSNCTHTHEPQCAIQEAIENEEISPRRVDSYHRIIESLE